MKPSSGRPSLEGDDGGDRLDAELSRRLRRVVVDVHLDELDAGRSDSALTAFSSAGRELLAGAAPGGPEIDEHGHLPRRLDDVLDEGRRGGVDDGVAARLGSRGRASVRAEQQIAHGCLSSMFVIAARARTG
jgi:hypothetical protein